MVCQEVVVESRRGDCVTLRVFMDLFQSGLCWQGRNPDPAIPILPCPDGAVGSERVLWKRTDLTVYTSPCDFYLTAGHLWGKASLPLAVKEAEKKSWFCRPHSSGRPERFLSLCECESVSTRNPPPAVYSGNVTCHVTQALSAN
ncbi:hypothetical protein JZ751_014239 [Albula glossodonta]|uniref:Uncharacterized protein n=1 Tax=Albula glossodonta TaxID=121402 RepID=A0A8T2P0T9_9TELE|nr:hypothetical protein JZ751_014239 [Albula glossodonta]